MNECDKTKLTERLFIENDIICFLGVLFVYLIIYLF